MEHDTLTHSIQVALLAKRIAEELKLSSLSVMEIAIAAICHDVGKAFVPKSILEKPAKLTDEEFDLMKMHTLYGNELLTKYTDKTMQAAAEVALNHHERFDGSGYMKKGCGDVSFASRIVAVADVYSALIEDRVYRPAWNKEDALFFIKENAGKQFDPCVVTALLAVINKTKGELINGIKDTVGASGNAGNCSRDCFYVH